MSTLRTLLASSAIALAAGAADAATLMFEIEAEVSHITNNVEADVEKGDTVRVQGRFDTESLFSSVVPNRMRFGRVFDVEIDGPVFGGHDDFQVSLLEARDDEASAAADLMRLIIDFNSGPAINAADYDRVRLSFYIPMALDTLDVASFLTLQQEQYPDLITTTAGRTAVMAGAFRFPTTQTATNGGFRGEVTSLKLAPIPLPAGGVLLLSVIGAAGLFGMRRKA